MSLHIRLIGCQMTTVGLILFSPLVSAQALFSPNCNSAECLGLSQSFPLPPQSDPNRDRFLQPLPSPPQIPPNGEPEIETPPPSSPPIPGDDTPFPISEIQIIGSSILSTEEINAIASTVSNQTITLNQLQNIADQITEIYLRRGYMTSRAVVPQQTITDGVVEILVIEGSLEKIEVEGTRRLNPNYIISRVNLGAQTPLNTLQLENQLRLLRLNPLFDSVEASLRPGGGEGQSILVVRVTEANPIQLSFSLDNYSPPSIGSQRLGVNFSHLNLTGRGDFLLVSYQTTRLITGGESDIFDFIYSIPVNAMNGTIQLRIPPYRNRVITEEFADLNIQGNSQVYEISYRQPLVRTPWEEFALSAGLSYQESQTLVDNQGLRFGFGPDDDGVTRLVVLKLGQDYIRRDRLGVWALRSQFSLGLGILNATNNEFLPNSDFVSWLGQIQRLQRIGDNHLLILQGDLQLTANPLFPSQQFVIGGAQSLRGYRQNVRAGDNGFRFSIEDRITLKRDRLNLPTLQLAPFLDMGQVWNHPNNPNSLPSQTFLVGGGLGLLWEPIPNLNIRLDYGLPLTQLRDRGDNLQDHGIYFNLVYTLN